MGPTFSFINYADSIKACHENGIEQESDQAQNLANEIIESSSKLISVLDFTGLENLEKSSDHFEKLFCSAMNEYETKFKTSLPLILVNIDDQRLDRIANKRVLDCAERKGCLIPVFGEYGTVKTIIGANKKIGPGLKFFFKESNLEKFNEMLQSYPDKSELIKKNEWLIREANNSYGLSFVKMN